MSSHENNVIYLDNNATTVVAPEVLDEMLPYYKHMYGNASSMHDFGAQLNKIVEKARKSVKELLGAKHDSEIIFTSGGTEGDNAAIYSAMKLFPKKKHFITTRVEHPAVMAMGKTLESDGYRVTYLGVDKKGQLSLDELKEALTDDTALVSIMWANNETGTIFPIEEAAHLAKSRGALFHTDAVQIVGKQEIDVKNTEIDMLSISGHKLHAPKGIGALYIKRGTRFKPMLIGGHQERGRRAGTENVPGIIALGKACEIAKANIQEEQTQVSALRDRLEQTILKEVDQTHVNGDLENRLPNTSNISFGFVEGEAILLLLNEQGICASSGSACSSGSLEPSHVLRAMGVPFTHAHGSIRFSLSRYNTKEEIDKVIEQVPAIINRLREISPYYKPKISQ